MANNSPNPVPKAYKENQPPGKVRKRVVKKLKKPLPIDSPKDKVKQKSPGKIGSRLASTLAIAVLLGSAGIIGVTGWISLLVIFSPHQIGWVNQFLPEWAKISLPKGERPQTLLQIQENLQNQGKMVGEVLALDSDDTGDLLLPVLRKRGNCQSDCEEIVELRIYQQSQEWEFQQRAEKSYYLATQLPVTGPEESFVIAPLVDARDEIEGSSIALPITKVGRFTGGTPSPGVWLYLQGKRQQATNQMSYGHILHYYPKRSHLQQMLSWTSPVGKLPTWEEVTGGGTRELIVDRTVGLEPQLKVYQVERVKFILNPIQLSEISLKPPAISDSAYEDALLIARSGLWTPAREWLEFIKKKRQNKIPETAQAQIDVIRLHSQLTKAQADKSWASPSQEVLADLIDGRWAKALQVFEASSQNAAEIGKQLKADGGRLWNRAETALQVNPNRREVQAWAALILAAREGQKKANSWLQSQPQVTPESLTYIEGLLAQLDGESRKSKIPTSVSRIIGSAKANSKINPKQWLKLDSQGELKSREQQVWYEIEVSAFHNGKDWLHYPFNSLNTPKSSPVKYLREILNINRDTTIEIVVWLSNGEQNTITTTIQAVQLQNGVLRLLAAGVQAIPHQNQNTSLKAQPLPLALTTNALEWVQPSPKDFEQLYQQQPEIIEEIMQTVWRSLQASAQIPSGTIPEIPQLRVQLGNLPVQQIDLTGNSQPETLVTISPEAIASLNTSAFDNPQGNELRSRPRTIILSDQGKVIYTDFRQDSPQTLTAIAKLADGDSLALLIEQANRYSLKRWKGESQSFH
ncbi:MAG: hypothetical protein QNJ47_20295 [Nostocaceae cyanobacterium]|nr:hypothetical protein [Nostocaceae cyanobacterium]